MSSVINTNFAALYAQGALRSNQSRLTTAMQRLSTGLRINSAKDDAAGLAICESMTAHIRGLNQAVRNINDGISLVQTAEGGLNSITQMLQRMRELAVQSANGTYSNSDRSALELESSALSTAIGQVIDTTTWNDIKLLDGSFSAQKMQIGANAGESLEITIPSASLNSIVSGSDSTGAVSVSVSPTAVAESGSNNLIYTFTRSGDISSALSINVAVGGTATPPDYTSSISIASAATPTKVWTQQLGSSGDERATGITTGLDGAIYVTGVTDGALDGQANNGYQDAFLTKYNADGTKVWTQMLGSSETDVAFATTTGLDGAIYISGYTDGLIGGHPNFNGYDAFLTKFSADGTKVWTQQLGSVLSTSDIAYATTTGLDGAIYISGVTGGSIDGQTNSGGQDAFLTKYSADGTKAWTKMLGSSSYEQALALTTGLDGSIYVSGFTDGALDGQTKSGGYDAFLTKYSPDGTKAWTQLLGTSANDYGYALTTGLDGSIYIGGNGGTPDGQGYDGFLTKYNADGTKAWTQLLGSSETAGVSGLTTGLDGAIYVSGGTRGPIDGQNFSGYLDAFVTKYSADGTKAWTQLLGSIDYDIASALTTGLDGSIYVSGYTWGSIDGQTSSGGQDAFITKFSSGLPQITFAAGASTATCVVSPTADNLAEGSESIAVTVLSGTGYTVGAATATGTIFDGSTTPEANPAVNISTAASAANAIAMIDAALNATSSSRATLGSYMNRLIAISENLTNQCNNLTASRSTIMDADYASESTNLAKSQIIQQAATAMLAQANQQPQSILALLKTG